MKNFLKYFVLAFKISRGKIAIIFILAFLASFAQICSVISIFSVINISSKEPLIKIKGIEFLLTQGYFHQLNLNQKVSILLLFTAFFFLTSGLLQFIDEWYKNRLMAKTSLKMQREFLDLISNIDYEEFISYNIGKIGTHFGQIAVVTQSLRFFTTFICGLIFSAGNLFLPLLVNYKVTLLLIILGFPFVIITNSINKRIKRISNEQISNGMILSNVFFQFVANYKYFKVTATNKKLDKIFSKNINYLADLSIKLGIWSAVIPFIIPSIVIIIVCFIIYWQVILLNIPIIEACASLGLVYNFIQKSMSIPNSYQKFIHSSASIDSYYQFLMGIQACQENIATNKEKMVPTPPFDIKLENISFSYRNSNKKTIDNVSLHIPPSSMIAFVGESGSGKSTLVNIIAGLLKPQSGKILINNVPYDQIDIQKLRQSISYVIQEPVIFNDTVLNNVTLWDEKPDMPKFESVIAQVNANKFVEELPKKHFTLIGFSGANLSGGQKQRLCIARELYKNAPLLIMDEATSALDSETESIIYENIKKIKGEKIIIIIAHRLATVKDCDKIFVLNEGKLIEEGTFDELIKRNGKFKQMVDKQVL